MRSLRYPYIFNGLLFGSVVGAGFGTFETIQYAFSANLQNAAFYSVFLMFFRGALETGTEHTLWTGMSAAALWMVKGKRSFRCSMLLHWKLLIIFLITVGSYMLRNSAASGYVWLALGVFNWCVIFILIKCGLDQLRNEKIKYAEKLARNLD